MKDKFISFVKSYFNNNPDIFVMYANAGMKCMTYCLKPMTLFMRHLLFLRGLDPNNTQQDKEIRQNKKIRQMSDLLNDLFKGHHSTTYDKDFEWKGLKFKEVADKLPHLDLSPKTFDELTDLRGLLLTVKEESLPVIKDKVREKRNQSVSNNISLPVLDSESVNSALESLKEIAKELDENEVEDIDSDLECFEKLKKSIETIKNCVVDNSSDKPSFLPPGKGGFRRSKTKKG